MNDILNILIALFVVTVIGAMTYFLSFQTLSAIDRLVWGISVHVNDQSIMARKRDPITGKPSTDPTIAQQRYDEGVRSLPPCKMEGIYTLSERLESCR